MTGQAAADLLVEGGLCTVPQAAAFLSLARSTVYALMDRGEIPFAKFGRARRIPKRALVAFASRHLVGGQEEEAR